MEALSRFHYVQIQVRRNRSQICLEALLCVHLLCVNALRCWQFQKRRQKWTRGGGRVECGLAREGGMVSRGHGTYGVIISGISTL